MIIRPISYCGREYADALEVRRMVLREPLGLEFSTLELDDEKNCFHLAGFEDERLVAVLLLRPQDARTMRMRQVAVQPSARKRGWGSQLVRAAETFASQRGFVEMIAHARVSALGFYLRMGYEALGGEFVEATIPHRVVRKNIGG